MKTITYAFGIFALLATMSSCTTEELELANNSSSTLTDQAAAYIELSVDGDIDPPVSGPKK